MTIIIDFVRFLVIDEKFHPCYKIPSKINFQNIQYYTTPFTDKPFFNISSVVFSDLTLSDIFYVRSKGNFWRYKETLNSCFLRNLKKSSATWTLILFPRRHISLTGNDHCNLKLSEIIHFGKDRNFLFPIFQKIC